MKKLMFVFIAALSFSSITALATERRTDFKKCFKACMKHLDDKEKCEYICDDNIKPPGM